MGIISGLGSFRGQFGDHFRVGDHFGVGIISGAVQISVDIKSPRVRIARFRRRRVDSHHEDLSKGDAFALPYRSARAEFEPVNCKIDKGDNESGL